jgi:subfamily B ATP-binding cassette protein MsbA
MAVAMSVVVWLALRPEILGNISAGAFIAYIGAAGLLSKPVRSLTEVNEKIQRGLSAADSVFRLIDTPAEPDTGTLQPVLQGQIRFDRVDFSYPDGTQALQGFDLDIKSGQTVALVGRSGAGKTTLTNLLLRFVNPSAGQIRLDGVPIEDLTLESLRRQVATVSQQVILFDDTVRNNIAYGSLSGASQAEVEAAARAAYAHDFILQLPQGYDTVLGANGLMLSGGQRQRLAIARALLKQAPILILDEATSALDNESEHFIQQALAEAMQHRTTLVIAHRLSTIEQADWIVVMDRGRIVEQGTHLQLLAQGGLYAQLHSRQFSD